MYPSPTEFLLSYMYCLKVNLASWRETHATPGVAARGAILWGGSGAASLSWRNLINSARAIQDFVEMRARAASAIETSRRRKRKRTRDT